MRNYKEMKKKMKRKLSLFLIVLLIVSLFSVVSVSADDGKVYNCPSCGSVLTFDEYGEAKCSCSEKSKYFVCSLCGDIHDYSLLPDVISATAFKVATIGNGTFENIGYPVNLLQGKDSLMSILRFDVSDSGNYDILFGQISSFYDILALIGTIILLLYFFLDLMTVSMNEGFTYDSLVKHGIKTILGIFIIQNGLQIITYGITVVNAIFDTVMLNGSSAANLLYSPSNCPFHKLYYYDSFGTLCGNMWESICLIFSNIIPCAAILISYVFVRVACWARVMDIAVRVIFAPIGMSDTLHGGLKSDGIRYLKRLLASVFSGAVLMGVLLSYQAIRQPLMGSFNALIANIALSFAVIAMTRKAQTIANDAMGV